MFLIDGIVAFLAAIGITWRRRATEQRRLRAQRNRAERQLRHANFEVDRAFRDARVAMEEQTGQREPGERRFGDGLTGSWSSW